MSDPNASFVEQRSPSQGVREPTRPKVLRLTPAQRLLEGDDPKRGKAPGRRRRIAESG